MKTQDLTAAANAGTTVDQISQFEVTQIGSIAVTANLLRTSVEGRTPSVSMRVFPGDPNFAALETMIREFAATQKTAAQAVITASGVPFAVDAAAVTAAAADTAVAQQQLNDLKAQNAAKAALAAAQAAVAAGTDPQAAAQAALT